ncbi:hypothetical protein [Archangium sp.]|uniref:hypothetical protein n=1 Tax=Archangium sp. TaxID=1872627 RepID=UPI002D4D19A3|nr:hypothetical protein [Archangium sp.]HYO60203.1 hypothetical protein [Archangium sp.]
MSLGYGISGTATTVALLSLALNLFLTGLFILGVRRLRPGACRRLPAHLEIERTSRPDLWAG